MKYLIILLTGFISVNAITLNDLVIEGINNNRNLKISNLDIKVKDKNYKEVENIYKPTINLGLNYNRIDFNQRTTQVGDTFNGYLNLNVNLYDGGKNKSIKNQKKLIHSNSKLQYQLSKKDTILNIVNLYYQIKSNNKNIEIYKEKEKLLMSEYKRVWNKFKLNMITRDEVLKFKSEYENNKYLLSEMQYKRKELLSSLYILTGLKNIDITDNYKFPIPNDIKYKDNEEIQILNNNIEIENKAVDIINASKKIQIQLSDTLSIYDYENYNSLILKDLPDYQNQLMLNFSYNLYDTQTEHKKEAALIEKLKLKEELKLKKDNNYEKFLLIKEKLKTDNYKIHSTKTALNMSKTVFDIIKDKYNNGLVDNITYLDALNKFILNRSLYNISLYNFEIDKIYYYYYSGINIENLIKRSFK